MTTTSSTSGSIETQSPLPGRFAGSVKANQHLRGRQQGPVFASLLQIDSSSDVSASNTNGVGKRVGKSKHTEAQDASTLVAQSAFPQENAQAVTDLLNWHRQGGRTEESDGETATLDQSLNSVLRGSRPHADAAVPPSVGGGLATSGYSVATGTEKDSIRQSSFQVSTNTQPLVDKETTEDFSLQSALSENRAEREPVSSEFSEHQGSVQLRATQAADISLDQAGQSVQTTLTAFGGATTHVPRSVRQKVEPSNVRVRETSAVTDRKLQPDRLARSTIELASTSLSAPTIDLELMSEDQLEREQKLHTSDNFEKTNSDGLPLTVSHHISDSSATLQQTSLDQSISNQALSADQDAVESLLDQIYLSNQATQRASITIRDKTETALDLSITLEDGQVTLSIEKGDQRIKDALNTQADTLLKPLLEEKGMSLASVSVDVNQNGSSNQQQSQLNQERPKAPTRTAGLLGQEPTGEKIMQNRATQPISNVDRQVDIYA